MTHRVVVVVAGEARREVAVVLVVIEGALQTGAFGGFPGERQADRPLVRRFLRDPV